MEALLAGLCAAHMRLNAEGLVTSVRLMEPRRDQLIFKGELPNDTSLVEAIPSHWKITIRFPFGLYRLEEDGILRWHVGQIISLEGELCATPFRMNVSPNSHPQ